MKFTRDLCRLLGLGGDGPGEEELEAQDGASDPADGRKGQSSEVTVKNEEGLDEKERAKRRAERRRAKRKRQKERKKLEREERMEDALEQEEASGGAVTESNSEEEYKEEESWTAVRPSNKCNPETVPGLMTTENKNNCKLPHRTSEEMEPEWDVSSAFVANAASHIKLKGLKSRGLQITRENKENEARSSQGENTEEMKRRGESLTEQGIQMFGRGQYSQAVHMFSEAIYCDPKDHRFYGNRSYCYLCLEQYSSALKDAQRSIELAPDWPKGFFRKGCALMGLKGATPLVVSIEVSENTTVLLTL
nr:PREDICTED: hsp70-Hsp90 organizing protein-like isoform X2 [Paralichthys olivaceus]